MAREKNHLELDYKNYKIRLFQTGVMWVCEAYTTSDGGGLIKLRFRKNGNSREAVLDEIQGEIDMADCAADKSIQVSNKGLHEWLSQ